MLWKEFIKEERAPHTTFSPLTETVSIETIVSKGKPFNLQEKSILILKK